MSLSMFAKQIESMLRDKNEFENNARQRLIEALKSFISTTEVKIHEVSFKQDGFLRQVNELDVYNDEFKFEWVIDIAHEGYNLQASVPVYAVRVWGNEFTILFGVGEHPASGGQEDHVFMENLIKQLQKGICSAFP